MTRADLAKIETLISTLRDTGFATAADQLDEAVHQTTYPGPVEMFAEIGIAVRAAFHLVGPAPPDRIAAALAQARDELIKISPGFRF